MAKRRHVSRAYAEADAQIDIEYERKEKERRRQYYLSQEPVYEIKFDDGTMYWIDYKGNENISQLSFVTLWGGQDKFTEEEILEIDSSYLKHKKRYLG